MKSSVKALLMILVSVCFILIEVSFPAQIQPISVPQPMPDFSLPFYQGGEVSISQLTGKNVLLIFPRGLAGKDHWCHVCNYQHAELAELEIDQNIPTVYIVEEEGILRFKYISQNTFDRPGPDYLFKILACIGD